MKFCEWFKFVAPVLSLSLSLSGCGSDGPIGVPDFPEATAKMEPARQAQVAYSHQDMMVTLTSDSTALPETLLAQLDAFVAQNTPVQGLHAVVGVSSANSKAEPLFLAMSRELHRQGIASTSERVQTQPVNQVMIELGRYTIAIPPCQSATFKSSALDSDLEIRRFGCASDTDLAAMVADPADLVAPQTRGASDGTPAATAVSRYESDKITPLLLNPDLPIRTEPGKPTRFNMPPDPSPSTSTPAPTGGGS